MMSDAEIAKVKEIRDSLFEMEVQLEGEDADPELKAAFVGNTMANVDGLFAIREGESWRGLTDPKEIARAVLRQMEVGE